MSDEYITYLMGYLAGIKDMRNFPGNYLLYKQHVEQKLQELQQPSKEVKVVGFRTS